MDDQSIQQFQELPDTKLSLSNAKAMLYDREGFGGKAPQALLASKGKSDPQQWRDGTAAVAGMSAILGVPSETVAENFSQYQNKVEGQMGWDHSPNVGGFANNLASHFKTQDAQQKAIQDLQTQAVQKYADFSAKGMTPNPLAAFSEWDKATGDAFKGVSEDQKIQIFNSVYSPIQKQMASPEGQKALQLVNALQQNKEAAGISEMGADQASSDASQGKDAPAQPKKVDPVQFIKGMPEDEQNKVLSIASQLMQSSQPEMGNGLKVAGGLGQAFAQGFTSWGAIGNLDDLVEAEKRLKAAQSPEDAQKAQDDIEHIKLSQKIKQADQQANSVNPELYGLPKIAYKVGQGVAAMPGALAPALVPVLGEFAFYKQAQAEDALKLMDQNPSMTAEEAKSRSTIASAAYGITMGRLAPLLGEAAPGLGNFLIHAAQSTAIMQGAEGERVLGRQLQSLVDPSFNPKEQYGQEWMDLLKATPYTFATLAAFGGAIKLMNRGQAPDPNSAGELEKQAGNARTLQYLGFDAETAQKISLLPEGQRVKALGGEWENRTAESKQDGVELARQDAETANKVISDPTAPKVEQTPDGKFAVTTKNGDETHTTPFETQEGAQEGLQMAIEHHLSNAQDEQVSWEERMHRAEAVAKLHLMDGVEADAPSEENNIPMGDVAAKGTLENAGSFKSAQEFGDSLPDSSTLDDSRPNEVGSPYKGKFTEGELSIDKYGENPYVYENQYINPNDFKDVIGLEGMTWEQVVNMPTTQKYIEWYKEGNTPPAVTVVKKSGGERDGQLQTSNRRRLVAAIEAGVDRIPARVEIGRRDDIYRDATEGALEPHPNETLPDAEKPFPTTREEVQAQLDDLLKKREEEAAAPAEPEKEPEFGPEAPTLEPEPPAEPNPLDEAPATTEEKPALKAAKGKSKTKEADGITDFGEKIEGAKKDLWQRYEAAMQQSLPEDVKDISISKNFPEPDYGKLIEGGANPERVAAMKAIRDLIPRKPAKGYKLRMWGELVKSLHSALQSVISPESQISNERLNEILGKNQKIASQVAFYRELGYPTYLAAKDWSVEQTTGAMFLNGQRIKEGDLTTISHYKDRWTSIHSTNQDAAAGMKEVVDQIRPKIEIQQQATGGAENKTAKKVAFNAYRDKESGKVFIGRKGLTSVIRIKTGFDTAKEAFKYIEDNHADLSTLWDQLKTQTTGRKDTNAEREGKPQRTGNITPETFSESFGFRGVQFGNYVEGSRRQTDLNHSFDALMDLSEALGLSPKALSLDGQLGMAFGARGKGKAMAHYEPDNVVINLTKAGGPGSLAHEWFHAADNYFNRLDKTGNSDWKSREFNYASDNGKPPVNMRPEVWEAFKALRDALGQGEFSKRSKEMDETRSKPYWGTTIEKAARAFESYAKDKLAEKGISNDYLANIDEASGAYPTKEELNGGIKQAFDGLFNAIDNTELPKLAASIKTRLNLSRVTKESGGIDPTIFEDIADYGTRIFEKGMDFKDWAGKMLNDLGDKVKDVLARIWEGYKSLGNAGSLGGKADDFAKRVEDGQKSQGEKFVSANDGKEIPAHEITNPSSRDRIQAELDRQVASGPTARTRIFENASKRFDAIMKRQNTAGEALANGNIDSREHARKSMESNLVELNAILSALPPDIRASLSRNWRNPKTGEGGNIYTKYASLGSEKAKAAFLIKQIDKAGDLIDHSLSSEYLERGYKLLEAAQPSNERGKGLQGKLGAEGHELLNKITDLWHMDEGQVADYIQSRQKQLADPELSDEKRNELEQEIHFANIHGNFSPVEASGTYKHLGDEMPADTRAQALESLKQIIETGRLDWQGEKDANKAKWEANRSEVKTSVLGDDREATSAEIAKSREGATVMLSGVSNFFDSHLSHLARFTQILGDASKPWVRRILDATNSKADMDQKLDHESHLALIKTLFGDKAEDNLLNRTKLKMVISDLSKGKDTEAISIENRQFKKQRFGKTLAESFVKDPTTWMGTDTELNYLARTLSSLSPKSRVKGFDAYYPKEGTGEEVKLHLSEMEAIQRLLSWRQPDARLKMERNGMSQETADKLEEFVNKTKEGSAFYEYLKTAYDHYDKINAIYSKMFGVDMPRVKNYAPTSYDTAKGTEDPVSLDEYGGGASSMAGFTKTRQSHIAKVKDSNAWVTYQAHMDAVNYWLSHAELVRDFRATFGNTDVLRAVEVKSTADRKYLTDFIKYLSRDNATTGNLTGWNSKFARAASNILSNSALAFNIPVTLKHIIPSMSAAMKMDAGSFIVSALRVATGQAERPAIFGENNLYSSPEVMRFANAAHSGSDSDAAQVAKESKGFGAKTKLALEAGGKWGHSWITSLVHASNSVSSAIAYDGAYREAIKSGLSHEDADLHANQRVDEILHETSQPVFGVDRPIGEEGNPLQATIARFAGPVRQRFGIAVDAVKGAPARISAADTPLQKFGEIGDVSWKLAAAWVIPGIMEHAVKQAYLAMMGTNQQQEDANKLNEYIGASLAGPVYGMYYAGPVVASAIKAAVTGEKTHLSTGNPLFDEANSLVGAVKRKMGKKSDNTPISDDITLAKVSMDTAAMLMGLVGLTHAATATASISGALNPARVISKKLEDDGTVKKEKKTH
jgi:hypothetical protein